MMKERKRNNGKNAVAFAAMILLCLTLVSVFFTSAVYARYTAGSAGGDSARAAAFRVSAAASEAGFALEEDGTHTYTITITNSGETAARYEATVLVEGLRDPVATLTGTVAPGADDVREVVFTADALSGISGLGHENSIPFEVLLSFEQLD